MGLFDSVTFGPDDVKAVANGTAKRGTVMAVLTSQTCGEPCWHAREEICRCSCGGRNHGCLANGGTRPERTSRIGGFTYKLKAVGIYKDVFADAERINREAGYSYVDKPRLIVDSQDAGQFDEIPALLSALSALRAADKDVWVSQYYGTWRETDNGAPARIKSPTEGQRKWEELNGWRTVRETALLWVRVQMPERPKIPKLDRNGAIQNNT